MDQNVTLDQNVTPKSNFQVIFAGVIGNILEWYDFALFGFFAPTISKLYFPNDSPLLSLLQTFGVFAVGYFMRPLGGILFGHIGDRYGRKKALELSVLLMAIPTTLLGLLPTYQAIGILAPIMVVMIRIIQGISVGGELIGSISFLNESASPRFRGFLGSWSFVSAIVGMLLGSSVAALLNSILPQESLHAWGWRVPFLCGVLVGGAGLWLRLGLSDSTSFKKAKESGETVHMPVVHALTQNRLAIFQALSLTIILSVNFYMLFVWLSTWLRVINKPPLEDALVTNTISMCVILLLTPITGILSDRIGRKPILFVGCFGFAVLTYPLFSLLSDGRFADVLFAQCCFAVLNACITGPASAAYVELFPTKTRYSGIAIGYNAAQAIFGGTTPLIATMLIDATGFVRAPAFYLIGCAVFSGAVLLTMKDRSKEKLEEIV